MIHLLVNATVLTQDDSLPVAQALAVKDGRLVEVGGTDEILWLREDDYAVIDLEGRTVVPGFVDPHNHFSIGALEAEPPVVDDEKPRPPPIVKQPLPRRPRHRRCSWSPPTFGWARSGR